VTVINRNSASPVYDTLALALLGNMREAQICIVKNNLTGDGIKIDYEVKASGSGGIAMANGNELVAITSAAIDSVADLFGLVGSVDGQQISKASWLPGWAVTGDGLPRGGKTLIYESARVKTDHDGTTVFDPTRAVPTDFTDETQKETYRSEVINPALGCWVWRDRPSIVNLYDAGLAAGDDIALVINRLLPLHSVKIPAGSYTQTVTIPCVSDRIITADKGQTFVVIPANNGLTNITTTGALQNFTLENISFDGTANYPANSQVNKLSILTSQANFAVYITNTFTNVTIRHCEFKKMSNGSIRTESINSDRLYIHNNYFEDASYIFKQLSVFATAAVSDAEKTSNVNIYNNSFLRGGVRYHYDCSDQNYSNSNDCVHLDNAVSSTVRDNNLKDVGGIGIRIEESTGIGVHDNVVDGSGQDGITAYLGCYDVSETGNTVKNWGQVPSFFALREYPAASGNYYIAREFPDSVNAPLPADASASSWWVLNPYDLTQIDTSTILVYGATDYYASDPVFGILPFRGFAAISTTSESYQISCTGNTCTGDLTQIGGKYTNASDFGYTPVHSVNSPVASGADSTITGNTFKNVIQQGIYHPRYFDDINQNEKLSRSYYANNVVDNIEIWSNLGAGIEAGTFEPTLTTDGAGTITINPSYSELYYSRVGDMVNVIGELRVSSVSGPTGNLFINNLPFLIGGGPDNSEFQVGQLRCVNFVNPLLNECTVFATIAFTTTMQITDGSAGADAAVAAQVQAGSNLTFSMQYKTGE
jgi:hypothetical protein